MARKIALSLTSLNNHRLEKIRESAPEFELIDISGGYTQEDMSDCEIIFGHITTDMIKAARSLKWFHSQTAGVDSYLKPEIGLPESVIFTNSSGAYGIGISEHLLTVTLMLMRRMGEYGRLQHQSKWEKLGTVRTMHQSLITVVGIGDIGGNYAARCRALGARVRGVARSARTEKPDCVDELFTVDMLDEAIVGADVVALCLPGTGETCNLFSKERMLAMKKDAIILNIGRGSAINQDALIELLESGHLGAAGLDVTTPEPLPPNSKLWDMPNVIITPHVSGGISLELTLDLIVDKFVKYLQDYIAGRTLPRIVDRKLGY